MKPLSSQPARLIDAAQRPDFESGIILPVVLAIILVAGLLQLRIEQRLLLFSKAAVLQAESIKAGLAAQNSALISAAGAEAPAANIDRNRLLASPVRLESVSATSGSGAALGKAAALLLLPAAANGFLPDWNELRKLNGEKLCPFDFGSRADNLSARTCSAMPERGTFFQGNFSTKEAVRISAAAERIVIASTGDLEIGGGIELSGRGEESRLELIALGSIKIKSITRAERGGGPAAILIHSARGEILIEKSDGLELCPAPHSTAAEPAAAEVSARIRVETPLSAAVGRSRLPAGQNGCSYPRSGPGWTRRRLIGIGPGE